MKGLLEIQEIDLAILRLEARRAVLESGEEVRTLESAADEAETRLGELRLEHESLSSQQRRLESDLDMQGQRLKAEEKRLYDGTVTNMKELEAIQHEIASIKDRRSRMEDDMLERMERIEELDARIVEAEDASGTARQTAVEAASGADAELARVLVELETQAAEREQRAAAVDPELLELYDDIRAHKKGVGAAALVDGVCQGCHEALSPMELDKLRHSDGVARCENCRRILVP